jgi:pyruvate kinase
MRDQAISDEKPSAAEILCSTATAIALENNVDMYVTITKTGQIARALARQRPMQTILACSTLSRVVH